LLDVLIIGAGLSGAIAATVLARQGRQVAMVDRYAECPPSFRAEQLVGPQVEAMARLGVLDGIVAGVTPETHAIGARGGRIVGGINAVHYGLPYQTMVDRARAQAPAGVIFIVGRVMTIQTGPTSQFVTLGSGQTIEARLVIVATGQERALAQQIGIGRRMIRAAHSLTIGFDITPKGGARFLVPMMTCYPTDPRFRTDYLAIFPIGDTTRANLFTYCDVRHPWIRSFRDSPEAALLEAFPDLDRLLGPFSVANPVQLRVNDLWMATGWLRDGMVLIGDAFQTSCPATGTGVSRLLMDNEQLCLHYVPRWLSGQGVTADQISAFYQDPVKRACDEAAAEAAEYQRLAATETGVRWRVHRFQVGLRQQIGGLLGGPSRLSLGYTFARLPSRSAPRAKPRGGIPHVRLRPAIAEAQEPVAAGPVEIDTGGRRDPDLRQHAGAEGHAVIRPVDDVGEQIESPLGR
jgi:2-polyprenyl-6-methoxyphenol hydroxylase-like FAD-dependent oxidoreductase